MRNYPSVACIADGRSVHADAVCDGLLPLGGAGATGARRWPFAVLPYQMVCKNAIGMYLWQN